MDLIRIGLQNLDDARANLDRLKADGVSDERLVGMLKALSKVCDPDCALSNFVDITNAMQSQGRDFDAMVPTKRRSNGSSPCSASLTPSASSCDSVQNSWRPQPTMPAKATFTITNSAERMCSNR